ncbi:hypothetical protein BP6252_11294 [Coleophoma cylindrospora]|uniref:DUF6590 domain-containing protein n=1 Tax=Coleophoma cylindrospora TaxID=1849047 RepID=A0A3D8QPL8_9HELO|nr:hypothetical protein BP6252_11294 [Coleophoma cylindrospora]
MAKKKPEKAAAGGDKKADPLGRNKSNDIQKARAPQAPQAPRTPRAPRSPQIPQIPEQLRVPTLGGKEAVHRASTYTEGDIIHAVSIEMDIDQDVSKEVDENRSMVTFQDKPFFLYSKYRRFVILEKWERHCTVLPIYSYNGQGLENKMAPLRREHMSIYFTPSDHPGTYQPESETNKTPGSYGSAYAVTLRQFNNLNHVQPSYIHVTKPQAFLYNHPSVIIAKLDGKSQEMLQQTFINTFDTAHRFQLKVDATGTREPEDTEEMEEMDEAEDYGFQVVGRSGKSK